MAVTMKMFAGNRKGEKVPFEHTFATNSETVKALVERKAPEGFDSYQEFFECARAHKVVKVQNEHRPGSVRPSKVRLIDQFND